MKGLAADHGDAAVIKGNGAGTADSLRIPSVMERLNEYQHFFQPLEIYRRAYFHGLKNAVFSLFHHGYLSNREPFGKDSPDT